MCLRRFLQSAKGFLKTPSETLTVVLGNESCDLDSVASSIVFAQRWSKLGTKKYVPIMNVAKADFRLRSDIVWLLNQIHVSPDDLVFIDDDLFKLIRSGENTHVRVALVDHNNLGPSLSHLDERVDVVIDHHLDERKYTTASPRIVVASGSCASLVTALVNEAYTNLDDMSEDAAKLLLGAIVADTICMDKSKGRYKPEDEIAIELLRRLSSTTDHKLLFQDLLDAKNDITGLSASELLRRDYKQRISGNFTFGIASISCSLEELAAKPALESSIQHCVNDNNLACLGIMSAFHTKDGFFRELAVFGKSKQTEEELCRYLEDNDLELKSIKVRGYISGALYSQSALTKSRKVMLPLFDNFFKLNSI